MQNLIFHKRSKFAKFGIDNIQKFIKHPLFFTILRYYPALGACDLEDSEACWMLSTWYLGPQTKFKTKGGDLDKQKRLGQLEKNPEKALEYGIRACEMNVPQSCANVSRMFRLGDGIPKNLEKAKEYHDKASEIIELLKSRNVSAGFTGA
uniref:Uncharacterized protein n=1 Tax=Panagrolaimus sp. PS1159 TaxID=55785 RepID=A0AC35GLF3_9BILA